MSKVSHVCLSNALLIPSLFEGLNANLPVKSMTNAVGTEELKGVGDRSMA